MLRMAGYPSCGSVTGCGENLVGAGAPGGLSPDALTRIRAPTARGADHLAGRCAGTWPAWGTVLEERTRRDRAARSPFVRGHTAARAMSFAPPRGAASGGP